jgi:MFS family permease
MSPKMRNILFLTNFAIFVTGMGLLPVLPLYAGIYGASSTVVGFYLATTYASIAAGSLLINRLLTYIPLKPLFIGAGSIGTPALILLGRAETFWQVVVLTGVVWFVGGIGLGLVSVLTGLYASDGSRGKSFGLMFLARPMAGVFGGLLVGQMIGWQGYPLTFVALAVIFALWPLAGLGLEGNLLPRVEKAKTAVATSPSSPAQSSKRPFFLLLVVVFLSTTAVYVARLSTSLAMESLAFSAQAIASVGVVGSLVTIPLTPLLGGLSDRINRRHLLILTYALAGAGAIILSLSTQVWHFWLETVLLFIATAANGAIAAALATDLLPKAQVRSGLPRLNAIVWLAGILGFATAGFVIETLGITVTGWVAAAIALLAGALLLPRPQPNIGNRRLAANEPLPAEPALRNAPCS